MKVFLRSRLTWLSLIGASLILWLWAASIRHESTIILLGPRSYCVGHNDSVVFLGWWDYVGPRGGGFSGPRRLLANLHGSRDSQGPLFPGFRMKTKLGLFDRVFMVPYWSLVLGWIVIWLVAALYLRGIGKRVPVAVGPGR
jgi:hypothetical protein